MALLVSILGPLLESIVKIVIDKLWSGKTVTVVDAHPTLARLEPVDDVSLLARGHAAHWLRDA